MERIAHRGCADHNPENTVRAVAASAERLPAVEVDVRRCGSGEIVGFHDERVDAITDGTGRVGDLDLATLRSLGVGGTDAGVATLEEILETVPGDVTLQIELKEPGLHEDVRAAILESGAGDEGGDAASPFRISSFSAASLAEITRSDWDPETGLLFGEQPTANLDLAAVLECENVHPHVDLCRETSVVDRAHGAGFGVYAWGLSDTDAIPALAERGVDGVTTDSWDAPATE